jgi:hypothetical protein
MKPGTPFWFEALRRHWRPEGDPPPASSTDNNDDDVDDAPKYTETQMKKRLQGSGKEIDRLRAALAEKEAADKEREEAAKAEAERKAVENGEAVKALEAKDAELKAARERLEAFEAKEQARREALETANREALEALKADKRFKSLPAEAQEIVLSSDPEEAAKQLRQLQALLGALQEQPKRISKPRPTRSGDDFASDAKQRISQKLDKLHNQSMGRR